MLKQSFMSADSLLYSLSDEIQCPDTQIYWIYCYFPSSPSIPCSSVGCCSSLPGTSGGRVAEIRMAAVRRVGKIVLTTRHTTNTVLFWNLKESVVIKKK